MNIRFNFSISGFVWKIFVKATGIWNNPFYKFLLALFVKYNKSIAQIILRWLTQRGVAVIPKSVKKERMVENFSIFDFEIEDADMENIKSLDTKTSLFFDHRNPEIIKRMGSRKLDI